jgi:phosphoglycolate phosphatase
LKRYEGYLFDLDGTLVDTAPDLNLALNFALDCHGYATVNEALTRHWVGHGAMVLVEQALAFQDQPDDDTPRIHQTFLEYYQQHVADLSQPYPGVTNTLERLSASGAHLGVVTNKRTSFSVTLLKALQLEQHFAAVVCGDTTTAPKPDPEPALHACRALGTPPHNTLLVGDSQTDVLCARAAGCPIVCVDYGYRHGVPADQLGADSVIESLSALV